MKETIKAILTETRDHFNPNARPRSVDIDVHLPKVKTIVGPRRAGKSSLLRHTIAQLLKAGSGWDRICYLALEDERLRSASFSPDMILQAFRELYPENSLLRDVYFFFDEIQYLPKWEPFINRIHEQISRNVVITGSNSRTLHTEVATVLRGRSLPVELLPLSFSEYLSFRDIPFAEYGQQTAVIKSAFHDYIERGGFPEMIGLPPAVQLQTLQEYFNTIIYRDILDRSQPANYSYLRYLFHRIAANTGKPLAIVKMHRELKSRGFSVGKNTLYDMVQMAEDVYLYKRIARFDPSLIKREGTEKKGYFVDTGMLGAITGMFSKDLGMLFENMIFWHLYRQYGSIYTTDIYYFKDSTSECDFILYREGGNALPVQVCWSIDAFDTRQRELKGLLKACQYTESKIGILITTEHEETIEENGVIIHVIAAWKWCSMKYDLFELS